MIEKQPHPLAFQSIRGMHDALPDMAALFARMEMDARHLFRQFGYQELRTPIVEPMALFERALGTTTDIVEKEMFLLQDQSERLLCLRPEGTAGIVRAYLEHTLDQQVPVTKFFYMGPMFRAERPQSGRYRQFNQIGIEYFGNAAPSADAETIVLADRILRILGVEAPQIQLNSLGCTECRRQFQANLQTYLSGKAHQLCADCQKRMQKNPLRALDCKVDQDRLKDAPTSKESLCEACAAHHASVLAFLKDTDVQWVENPLLVRGLDYYTRTVFEAYATGKSGSQDALAAGGRYDNLVQELGGKSTPAIGFALGMERVIKQGHTPKNSQEKKKPRVFVAALGAQAIQKCFSLLCELRAAGFEAEGVLNEQSLKSQMRLANALSMNFCLILGDNEIAENSIMVRNLASQSQEKIHLDKLFSYFEAL